MYVNKNYQIKSNHSYLLHIAVINWIMLLFCRGPFRKQFRQESLPMLKTGVDPGKPLFLTPYIESGQIDQGEAHNMFIYFYSYMVLDKHERTYPYSCSLLGEINFS